MKAGAGLLGKCGVLGRIHAIEPLMGANKPNLSGMPVGQGDLRVNRVTVGKLFPAASVFFLQPQIIP
jgi:hypothetical protein